MSSLKFGQMEFADDDSDVDYKPEDDSLIVAESLLAGGKSKLQSQEVHKAVEDLSLSCNIYSKVFGEAGSECAEAYFYYGVSLLELSRLEAGVLELALEGIDLDTEDETSGQVEEHEDLPKDEREEVAGLVAEALEENFQMHNDVSKIHSVEIMDYPEMSDCEDSEMDSDTSTDDSSEDEAEMEVAEVTGAREEPSNLELAWQMLELAKLVYTRLSLAASGEGKKGAEARLASTLLGLAEVSMEAGSFRQAVDDFSACLRVRKQSSPADSRAVAETYYQLAVAQASSGQIREAETSFHSAIAVLDQRRNNLGKMEHSDNIRGELADLDALVGEIREKMGEHLEKEPSSSEISAKPHSSSFKPTSVSGAMKSASEALKSSKSMKSKYVGSSTVGCA